MVRDTVLRSARKAAALEADARCAAVAAHRERAAAELAALGGPITGAADDHDQRVAAAIDHVNAIEAELRGLVTAAALAAERRDPAARAAADARTRLAPRLRHRNPCCSLCTRFHLRPITSVLWRG